MYQPIENYGIIGDMNTVALVGIDGSIDFMCYPDFDSPSVFASMLDSRKGGFFNITSQMRNARHKQLYLPDTNVLITRFLSEEGVAEITDFMPVTGIFNENCLIRIVTCVRGNNTFNLNCAPRFNYGRSTHKALPQVKSVLFIPEGEDITALKLLSTVQLNVNENDAIASFTLKPGEKACFMLTGVGDEEKIEHLEEHVDRSLFETIDYWRKWIGNSNYQGRWQESVNRSALILKLMTSRKYGSIVASATFSLPELIGGNKNWDYRYMWIRDAAFSLYALIRLGFTKEATHFIKWMEKHCPDIRKPGELGLMYSIRGNKFLEEFELSHFEGYMKSKPVRVGNAAYDQLQLDIYGELIDSIYLYNKYGEAISFDLWEALTLQVDWLCDNWNQPDEGIWEVREGRQHFLYSRLMCWVAMDRMLRMARYRSFPYPEKWRKTRDEIYRSIFTDFWNEDLKSFVGMKGGKEVDASTLLMPLTRFIGAKDPRWLSTMAEIEKQLVRDSLVYRYRMPDCTEDEMFSEGTFSLCSFWYVESLSRAGQLEKARYYFEKMLAYANHVGLYAEQIGLQGEHLGNFPQAFTHLGMISAAYNLNQNLNNSRNKQV
ncbi:MAG: Trehalase [Chlamydiales bacterium]|nr:Trehalase [Chlamydiales bacterium]MCH9620296.1 Trehalase [Chlamydiales bacterium]MCH9622793.1 Trehalase [Chlamydiales bacterium]